jgi:DNA-binding transcriptional LysR family regulator
MVYYLYQNKIGGGCQVINANHLKVFNSVATNLSFSRAAEELYTSQPSVSTQIKKLEEYLSIRLFEQHGKKVFLTEAGTTLFLYSQKVFSLIDEAVHAIEELKGGHKGRLLIGASTTPGVYLLPKILGTYKSMYPGIVPKLEIANSQRIVEMVNTNKLDIGIVGEEIITPPELHVEPWLKDELFLIVPDQHPWTNKASVHVRDLEHEQFIFRERGSSTRSIIENILANHGLKVSIALELNNTEAVKQAVSAGLGVSIVSGFSVIGHSGIVCLPIEGLGFYRMFNIIYHKNKIFSPATKSFSAFLKEVKQPRNI